MRGGAETAAASGVTSQPLDPQQLQSLSKLGTEIARSYQFFWRLPRKSFPVIGLSGGPQSGLSARTLMTLLMSAQDDHGTPYGLGILHPDIHLSFMCHDGFMGTWNFGTVPDCNLDHMSAEDWAAAVIEHGRKENQKITDWYDQFLDEFEKALRDCLQKHREDLIRDPSRLGFNPGHFTPENFDAQVDAYIERFLTERFQYYRDIYKSDQEWLARLIQVADDFKTVPDSRLSQAIRSTAENYVVSLQQQKPNKRKKSPTSERRRQQSNASATAAEASHVAMAYRQALWQSISYLLCEVLSLNHVASLFQKRAQSSSHPAFVYFGNVTEMMHAAFKTQGFSDVVIGMDLALQLPQAEKEPKLSTFQGQLGQMIGNLPSHSLRHDLYKKAAILFALCRVLYEQKPLANKLPCQVEIASHEDRARKELVAVKALSLLGLVTAFSRGCEALLKPSSPTPPGSPETGAQGQASPPLRQSSGGSSRTGSPPAGNSPPNTVFVPPPEKFVDVPQCLLVLDAVLSSESANTEEVIAAITLTGSLIKAGKEIEQNELVSIASALQKMIPRCVKVLSSSPKLKEMLHLMNELVVSITPTPKAQRADTPTHQYHTSGASTFRKRSNSDDRIKSQNQTELSQNPNPTELSQNPNPTALQKRTGLALTVSS